MGKIIKAEKRGGGIESKVIEEYTPLITSHHSDSGLLHFPVVTVPQQLFQLLPFHAFALLREIHLIEPSYVKEKNML